MKTILLFAAFTLMTHAQAGLGHSTFTCIDKDGDGYGVGPGCLGPDADDMDSTVQNATQAIAKYGTLNAFLGHLGYTPGNIFYMSTSGSDSTGVPNNPNQPYQTWAQINLMMAHGNLKAGDMVMFRAGTWTRTTLAPMSGAAGRPIILMAYPGERVTIDNTSTGATVITLTDQAYVTIDGLRVTGGASTGSGCITGASTDAQTSSTFHDNVFRHIEASGCAQGFILMNGLLNVTIEDSVIHDSAAGGQHCIYLGARELPNVNVTVHRNICYNAAWNGFHLNGRFTNLQVDQNIVYNVGIAGFSLQEGVSNSYFRNNLIFGATSSGIEISNYPGDCAQFGQGGTGAICPYDQTGNLFENNTVYQTGYNSTTGAVSQFEAVLVYNYSTNQVGNLGQQTFRNNIIVGYGMSGHYPSVVFRDGNKNYLATSTFTNNIFWSLDGATDAYVIGWGFNPNYGYQGYTCAQVASLTTSSSCINADPKFTNVAPNYYNTPAQFNFGIRTGSPAIGAGTPIGAPAADLVGTTRASSPSIGAYEPNSFTPSAGVTLSAVSCSPAALASAARATCTLTLSQTAASAVTATLSSNVQVLNVPVSVSVPVGSSSTPFTATAGTLTTSQNALITATYGTVSVNTTVSLVSATANPTLTSLTCQAAGLASGGSASCTVGLSQTASSAVSVSLSSNVAALSVQSPVSVASGSSAASFSISVGSVTSAQTAVISATLGSVTLTALVALSATTPASAPFSQGWLDLGPGTKYRSACPANNFNYSVCPSSNPSCTLPVVQNGMSQVKYSFASLCSDITANDGGGVADTRRNRLLFSGGGHAGYFGNEWYALNLGLATPTLTRISDPSIWDPNNGAAEVNTSDGTTPSRHTTGGIVYVPDTDQILSWQGLSEAGPPLLNTWLIDAWCNPIVPSCWHNMHPGGFNVANAGSGSTSGAYCAWDPTSHKVLCEDGGNLDLLAYDPVNVQNTVATCTASVSPTICVIPGHNFLPGGSSGWSANFAGATGSWSALNGAYIVTVLDANRISIPLNSSGFGSFTGTVTASTYNNWALLTAFSSLCTKFPNCNSGVGAGVAIDPNRKIMLLMGTSATSTLGSLIIWKVDLSPTGKFASTDLTASSTGCAGMNARSPSLNYDSALGLFVGYPGDGNTIYVYNPDTKVCTASTFGGGPPASGLVAPNGIYGRFAYFPALGEYALVNNADNDAFALKLGTITPASSSSSACDLNRDGVVNAADIQMAINQVLGTTPCTTAALHQSGQCNIVDVQRVVNASLSGICVTGQ